MKTIIMVRVPRTATPKEITFPGLDRVFGAVPVSVGVVGIVGVAANPARPTKCKFTCVPPGASYDETAVGAKLGTLPDGTVVFGSCFAESAPAAN